MNVRTIILSFRVEKSVLLLPGIKLHFLGHPVYQLSYPGSYFSVLVRDIMLCLAHFMKLSDYHNALLSKLLCFTEGTELLEGCVLQYTRYLKTVTVAAYFNTYHKSINYVLL
jgi:hypothetical protein